ncbi:hypothetical protein ILUMI_03494 [Ignelater luminosus]|uniref:Uncharacterized protein n=1 Tax=Ignelater luminosus TaxID=2038154 RepID=A0A8K0DLP7_IGNLU|nr:hypothetical protein ILUMI_03494 [Ignelater luminosus]
MYAEPDLLVDGLYIEPPEASTILTGKDSTEEEDNCEIDHLFGKQLAATVLRNSGNTEDIDSKSSNIQTTSNTGNHTYPFEMCSNNYSCVIRDLNLRCSRFLISNYSHLLVNKTVAEIEVFIDDEIVHYLVEQS